MTFEEIEVGKTYKVSAEDCCMSVFFTSKLVSKEPEWKTAVFENGVLLDTSYKDAFEEVVL